MIEVSHLTKDYGTVVALHDVSFRVGAGEVVGFLGPNGAGKSTTLRILSGFLGASSGEVKIAGHDIQREPLLAKKKLGYMPETATLYPEMQVGEYLRFRAALKHIPRRERRAAVHAAMEQAVVSDMVETLILHLSKGYRQRVALADALLGSPPLLILDEPTAGLDPNQIRDVRALIRGLGQKHTVLLSTHILSEVEATCDRALVIDRGRLVASGTLTELTALGSSKTLVAELRDPEGRSALVARAVGGVSEVHEKRAGEAARVELEIRYEGPADQLGEDLSRAFVEAGLGLYALTPGKTSLDEVFRRLTSEDAARGASAPSSGPASAEEASRA